MLTNGRVSAWRRSFPRGKGIMTEHVPGQFRRWRRERGLTGQRNRATDGGNPQLFSLATCGGVAVALQINAAFSPEKTPNARFTPLSGIMDKAWQSFGSTDANPVSCMTLLLRLCSVTVQCHCVMSDMTCGVRCGLIR